MTASSGATGRRLDGSTAGPRQDPRRALEVVLGVPFTEGNAVQVLRNGAEIFPAVLAAIRGATRSVDLLWFSWNSGAITERITAALADRAAHGVRVRILLDSFGAHHVDRRQLAVLRRAGCQIAFFRPLRTWRLTVLNQRTHRRVLVCDEQLALTTGAGVDRHYAGEADDPDHWRDSGVLVRGPAVAGLRGAFATDWAQTRFPLFDGADTFPAADAPGGSALQVVRAGSQPGYNEAALALHTLLALARRRVRLVTPYVRVPKSWHRLLGAAVRRGVQVQIVLSGPHVDRRWVQLQSQRGFAGLLRRGVELWCYQPTLMHAKLVTVDGRFGMVGTTNLDLRSLALNEQVGVLADDPALTAVLDAHIDDDLGRSQRLTETEWGARGLRQRALEVIADLAGQPMRGLGAEGLTRRLRKDPTERE